MTAEPTRGSRVQVASWCLYDWANSAFNTLVVTFVYSTYFSQAFADDPDRGTELWSRGVALSGVAIALLAPVAGALADRGDRRRYLVLCTLTSVVMTAALAFVSPAQAYAVPTALAIFIVANVAFELALVFYNAFLPRLAPGDRLGRVSGYGWALGFAGGLGCLALALPMATSETPVLGLSTVDGFNVRATNLLVAGWFCVFSLPIFVVLRDEHVPQTGFDVRGAWAELRETVARIRQYRDIVRFLVARLVYNDGLVTIFAFGGIYAAGTFGFTIDEVIVFGIVLNVVAGLGAWLFGFVDDRLGGKTTIALSLVFLTASVLLAALAPTRAWLWVAGCGIGLFLGPNQSASRSLMSRFVPTQHEAKFFGFYALSGKITAFAGPWLLGVLAGVYGQRWGVASVLLFFVAGGVLLSRVDEQRGIAARAAVVE